jgi:hypothetical protein
MAMMYEDIGYMRKAAFFTRKAARHYTSQHLPPQGWTAVSLKTPPLPCFKIAITASLSEDVLISVLQSDEKCFGWIQNTFW